MEHVEYTYTVGMDGAELEEALGSHGVGVLSLADGGRAYGVPVHYHYDDGSIFLRLIDDEASEKMAFLDATEEASFLVYGHDEASDESWSVVATGVLCRLTDDERERFDDAEINEDFGPMRIFGETVPDIDVAIYEFVDEEITGRRTTDAET